MSQTYKPSKVKRARKHGYMARKASAGGKNVLKSRMRKGRKALVIKTYKKK